MVWKVKAASRADLATLEQLWTKNMRSQPNGLDEIGSLASAHRGTQGIFFC